MEEGLAHEALAFMREQATTSVLPLQRSHLMPPHFIVEFAEQEVQLALRPKRIQARQTHVDVQL